MKVAALPRQTKVRSRLRKPSRSWTATPRWQHSEESLGKTEDSEEENAKEGPPNGVDNQMPQAVRNQNGEGEKMFLLHTNCRSSSEPVPPAFSAARMPAVQRQPPYGKRGACVRRVVCA
jgi:hypothetical protein